MKILIIEDEESLQKGLNDLLQSEGYSTLQARSLAEANDLQGQPHDLTLLDWRLPDGQGIELLKIWRAHGYQKPVIFLTSRAEVIDKVLGLEMGANDYVTKPFEPRELLARIRVQLRQKTRPRSSSHGVLLDAEKVTVTFAGRPIETTKMEFELLRLLLESPGRVFTRDELLNKVWGYEHFPNSRTVDTHVLQLRQKLSPELIETVRGIGYRWSEKSDKEES